MGVVREPVGGVSYAIVGTPGRAAITGIALLVIDDATGTPCVFMSTDWQPSQSCVSGFRTVISFTLDDKLRIDARRSAGFGELPQPKFLWRVPHARRGDAVLVEPV